MSIADAMDAPDLRRARRAAGPEDPFLVVRWDHELDRIAQLPRRPADFACPEWETAFRRPGSHARLRPIQARALHDLHTVGGLVGEIGVGWGKELIALLAATAVGARRPVIFVPAQLRRQAVEVDHPRWSREFFIYPLGDADWKLLVATYDQFSQDDDDLLSRVRPDLIVCNEAHKFRRVKSARTRRFLRYMRHENPACKLVNLSGTLTTKGPRDYAYLAELSLRHMSPVPSPSRAHSTLKEFDEALGSPKKGEAQRAPGALVEFCSADEKTRIAFGEVDPRDVVRQAYRRRRSETPGWVASSESAIACSLIITAQKPRPSEAIQEALAHVRRYWVVGEDEIEDGARLWAVLRQLSMGFYYRWDWPGGVRDVQWINARTAWHREVRAYLGQHNQPGMDSEGKLAAAAQAGRWKSETWAAWDAVRDRPPPPTTPVWVDPFFVAGEVHKWLSSGEGPGLIWYEHRAVGQRVSDALGLPLCAEGVAGARALEDAAAAGRHAVASIHAHREGKNFMVAWARSFFTCPPASGALWEQTVGRTHRPGQLADEVTAEVLAHTPELVDSLRQARADAEYLGPAQKLCYASLVGWPEAR